MSPLASCLLSIQQRPQTWLGRADSSSRSLSQVASFITGFQHGQMHPPDSLRFEYFTKWVAAHYRVIDGPMNWFCLIRERVGGDEALAFDEFFRLLPGFIRDMEQLGPDAIHAHYLEVMSE